MIRQKQKDKIKFYIVLIIVVPMLLLGGNDKDRIEEAGDDLMVLIPAVGLGSTILFEENLKGTGQFIKSFVTNQLITESLKRITHKRRPNGGCCKSFPSGHTSSAFMGAGFIHKRYGWKYSIPAYVGAAFVGYSRVQADKHFIEDVTAGAALGIFSSFYFTKPFKGFVLSLNSINGISISKYY